MDGRQASQLHAARLTLDHEKKTVIVGDKYLNAVMAFSPPELFDRSVAPRQTPDARAGDEGRYALPALRYLQPPATPYWLFSIQTYSISSWLAGCSVATNFVVHGRE